MFQSPAYARAPERPARREEQESRNPILSANLPVPTGETLHPYSWLKLDRTSIGLRNFKRRSSVTLSPTIFVAHRAAGRPLQ